MRGELFDSTLPAGEPELLRASAYREYLDELEGDTTGGLGSAFAQLSPSLRTDLQRLEQSGSGSDAVEVIAACMRHAKRVTVHLECGDRVVPLTLFPQERLVHCPMDMRELLERHLPQLRVMHVEPAVLRPPGDPVQVLVGPAREHHSLDLLLWELAMRGPRRDLLPEIAGNAAYRVAPSLDVTALPARGALRTAVERLRRRSANLRQIASWPALDRDRAARLLNGLYLQAGLIVSRSTPGATRDIWF